MQQLISRSSAGPMFAAAGAALLAAQALSPAMPGDTARQVAVAAAHRGAETGAAVAFLVAGALMVLGTAGTSSVRVERGRALARVGGLLTAIGALWPVAGRASYNAILVAVTGSGSRDTAVGAVHAVSSSATFSMFLPLLAAFAIGPVLLALGLRRAGMLPVWPAVLWLAGVLVVNATEASSRVVATLGMTLVAVALAWIGRAISTTTSYEAAESRRTVGTPVTA